MELSPFSLQHDWSLDWEIIPSASVKVHPHTHHNSLRERKALEAIASVGLIGKNQLKRLFRLKEYQLRGMSRSFKILKHKIVKNKEIVTEVYTLNQKGALLLELEDYKKNYWLEYFPDDVLKRLLYFQVFHFFSNLEIVPTPKPFIGGVKTNNGNMIYIYVAKGNNDDLLRYLKWSKKPGQRLILVVENVNQLKPLELYLDELKVKVVIENDILREKNTKRNIFYTYKDGRLVR